MPSLTLVDAVFWPQESGRWSTTLTFRNKGGVEIGPGFVRLASESTGLNLSTKLTDTQVHKLGLLSAWPIAPSVDLEISGLVEIPYTRYPNWIEITAFAEATGKVHQIQSRYAFVKSTSIFGDARWQKV
jgi:hypothetical protein